MMDQERLREAARRVAGWSRTAVLSHRRPDGDALGAMAAVQQVVAAAGRQTTAFVYEDVPLRYRFLADRCPFARWESAEPAKIDTRFDGILILDTCSWSQLEPAADFLRASRLPKVIIDHHATRDDLAGAAGSGSEPASARPAGQDADLYVIDPTAASASGLVFEWCEAAGWRVDEGAGEAIFAGMVSDTGWFRFSNTDARTLRAAARLIESCHVRPDVLYTRLYAAYSPARVRLMGQMLDTVEFHSENRVAVMVLTPEMFARAGATSADAEDLVNEPMAAAPVAVAVLLTDHGDGEIRVNLRSKSPEVIGVDVDVAAIARGFGGGGHHRAAGARMKAPLAEARETITKAVLAALG